MTIREYRDHHRPSMSDDVLAAGEFLESNGFRFLVDFGTANALDKASWLMTDRMEKDSWGWEIDGQR